MTYPELLAVLGSGHTARRQTWDPVFYLKRSPGGDVRLHDKRLLNGGAGLPWRQSGYDANATDYQLS